TREANGRELNYLKGWYAISEANRIFGFDGWNRETLESRCALARENRGAFLAVYIARVRVTVHADGATIIREATAPAKAAARHRGKCTTSLLRPRKPMPPNGHWRPSESRSVLSFIAVAGRCRRSRYPHRLRSLYPSMPVSASIRMIRPRFRGRPATMAAPKIWSLGIGLRLDEN